MTFKELLRLKEEVGELHLIIKKNNVLFEEGYAEPGMLCRLVSILPKPDYYILRLDFSGFEKHNERYESHDWYLNSNGDGRMGTMKEAGMYPKDDIDEHYIDNSFFEDDKEAPFEVVDCDMLEVFEAYLRSDYEGPMICWVLKKLDA